MLAGSTRAAPNRAAAREVIRPPLSARAWLAEHPEIAAHIRRIVDDMPPLPDETRALLARAGVVFTPLGSFAIEATMSPPRARPERRPPRADAYTKLTDPPATTISRRSTASGLATNDSCWKRSLPAPLRTARSASSTSGGTIINHGDRVTVRLDRRTYSPLLRSADIPTTLVSLVGRPHPPLRLRLMG